MTHSLIERLEKLQGPDREVDLEIALLCVPGARPRHDGLWYYVPSEIERDQEQIVLPLNYTSSIDAALTLYPEGWVCFYIQHRLDGDGENNKPHPIAIAICIAALRAIENEASKK